MTGYLTRAANLDTLTAIASCAPAAARSFSSYLDERLLESGDAEDPMQKARAQVASLGEPWVSGFDPLRLQQQVHRTGLEIVENLGPEELGTRYCAARSDGLHPSPGSHLARARVRA